MRTFRFQAIPDVRWRVTIPEEARQQFASRGELELVIVAAEPGETLTDALWHWAAVESFFSDRDDEDSVYDTL